MHKCVASVAWDTTPFLDLVSALFALKVPLATPLSWLLVTLAVQATHQMAEAANATNVLSDLFQMLLFLHAINAHQVHMERNKVQQVALSVLWALLLQEEEDPPLVPNAMLARTSRFKALRANTALKEPTLLHKGKQLVPIVLWANTLRESETMGAIIAVMERTQMLLAPLRAPIAHQVLLRTLRD